MSDAQFNALAEQVVAAVREFSALAKPIVEAQCERIGKTPQTLQQGDLAALAEVVGTAVGKFTTPGKGVLAAESVRRLRQTGA